MSLPKASLDNSGLMLTETEAAKLLRVSRQTVRKVLRPIVFSVKVHRYTRSSVEQLLAKGGVK